MQQSLHLEVGKLPKIEGVVYLEGELPYDTSSLVVTYFSCLRSFPIHPSYSEGKVELLQICLGSLYKISFHSMLLVVGPWPQMYRSDREDHQEEAAQTYCHGHLAFEP